MMNPYDTLPKVVGDYEQIERVKTGIWSIDYALGNPFKREWGIPLRSIYELSGRNHVGKSTLAYFLAGSVSKEGKVLLADFEGLDRTYLPYAFAGSGFSGEIEILAHQNKDKRTADSDIISSMADRLADEGIIAGIFDSVSQYQPKAEIEAVVGDHIVGRRAMEVGQFCRRASASLRMASTAKAVFVVNHLYAPIGGGARKSETAGGEVLKNTSAVRVRMFVRERFEGNEGELNGQLVQANVDKLRYGGAGREFQFFLVPGMGVHVGLSAMFNCFNAGIAERGRTVKMEDQSYGYINQIIKQAPEGNEPYADFITAIGAWAKEEHGYE